MKTQICLLLCIISTSLYSQINFNNHIICDYYDYIEQPSSVVSCDLDGDGDFDILSGSFGYRSAVWLKNIDGLGNFVIQPTIADMYDADGVSAVFAADVDGDGNIDVLSASRFDDKIAWYKNMDGLGSFGPQQVISNDAIDAQSIYSTDLDGDGDMDVLSGSIGDDKIAWYENLDGLGNFSAQKIISTSADGVVSIYSCDIDGDNDMDVVFASSWYDKVSWYENTDGLGNFGEQQIITIYADDVRNIFAIDIDNDGDNDLLSASYYDDKIAWYENTDGLGSFSLGNEVTTNADGATTVYAADIDNDGDNDVVSGSIWDHKVAWYENIDGLGSFGAEHVITTDVLQVQAVYIEDLDGDGNLDVISASYNDGKIAWYRNEDAQGDFGHQRNLTAKAEGANTVYASDIDGDGDMDVLSASTIDNKIAWYENEDGLGFFGAQRVITTDAYSASSVYAIDLDGDGDEDVLSASSSNDRIAWYENIDGQGSFGSQMIISMNVNSASDVFAIDIDNDGDMDVLCAASYDHTIAWFENMDGMGTFGVMQVITTEAELAESVYATDIDGDGDVDVLSASRFDDKIAWYENIDGYGTFGTQQIISIEADNAHSVYASDLDGDGDMDVLSALFNDSYNNVKIAWYENTDGQGTFGAQQTITINAAGATSVYAEDIDNDGDMDVISASRYNDEIAWYENTNGEGSFGVDQIIYSEAIGASSVFATDIDNDGDIDILSASLNDSKIAWYENLSIIGVHENSLLAFSIFPNPTNDILQITSEENILQIKIYDQTGQLVLSKPNTKMNRISISSLDFGVYYIKVVGENGKFGFNKIIKK